MAEAKSKAGRKTTLTNDLIKKICAVVRKGNFRFVAAQYLGISQRTFLHWVRTAKDDIKAERDTIYAQFLQAVMEAEQTAEISCVGSVWDKRKKDVKAAMWWLERKCPHWSPLSSENRQLKKELAEMTKRVEDLTHVDPPAGAAGTEAKPTPRVGGDAHPESI